MNIIIFIITRFIIIIKGCIRLRTVSNTQTRYCKQQVDIIIIIINTIIIIIFILIVIISPPIIESLASFITAQVHSNSNDNSNVVRKCSELSCNKVVLSLLSLLLLLLLSLSTPLIRFIYILIGYLHHQNHH